jgi:PEP-CTERM motif
MKNQICFLILCLMATLASGQGTLIYDQQSLTTSPYYRSDSELIQPNQPMGQSFTPALSSVGFISLVLWDTASNGKGAMVYLNLWAGSIGGTLLGSTAPIYMADNSTIITNFIFSTPVSVTPGTTYYFQPQLEPGSDDAAVGFYDDYNYTGGTMIANGVPYNLSGLGTPYDLWFREGIYVVPEPSPACLFLLGGGVLFYARRKRISSFSAGMNKFAPGRS